MNQNKPQAESQAKRQRRNVYCGYCRRNNYILCSAATHADTPHDGLIPAPGHAHSVSTALGG